VIKKLVLASAIAGFAMAAAGCGNPAGLVPVSGKVLYHGEPAAGAVVYFHRDLKPGDAQLPIPSATAEDDGSFTLSSDTLGYGALPGTYAVLVEWRDGSGDGTVPVKTKGNVTFVKRSRVRSGPDRVKGRYFNISKPLLHAEVKPGSNQLPPFELTD
jgi:hypothetical protein